MIQYRGVEKSARQVRSGIESAFRSDSGLSHVTAESNLRSRLSNIRDAYVPVHADIPASKPRNLWALRLSKTTYPELALLTTFN